MRGQALLLRAEKTGLLDELSRALAPWRKPLAIHDLGKIVFDLAVSVAIGGDRLADTAHLRGMGTCSGRWPPIRQCRGLITTLAAEVQGPVLAAINTACATARAHVWDAARAAAPDVHSAQGGLVVVDLDASLLTAHSEKESAAPTYKRGSGFTRCAFVDHGPEGTGEPVAMMLRPGNAGANTAADHITVTDQVLTQIRTRPDSVLIRTDSAGGNSELPHRPWPGVLSGFWADSDCCPGDRPPATAGLDPGLRRRWDQREGRGWLS